MNPRDFTVRRSEKNEYGVYSEISALAHTPQQSGWCNIPLPNYDKRDKWRWPISGDPKFTVLFNNLWNQVPSE